MRNFLRSPLFAIFVIVFVDVLGVGITVPVLPLFATDELGATPTQFGLLPSVYFVVQAVCAPLLGRTSDRVGRRPVLIFSQFGTLLAMLFSAWAPNLWWLFVARVLDGVTGGNITTAFAYVGDVSKPEERARAMGVVNAGFGAGFIFGPAIGGLLAGTFGRRAAFLAAAIVSLFSISLTVLRLKESRKPGAAPLQSAPAHGAPAAAKRGDGPRPGFAEMVRTTPGLPRLMVLGFFMQLAMLCFTNMWVLWADATVFAPLEEKMRSRWVGGVFTVLGMFQLLTQALVVGRLVKRIGEKRMVTWGLALRGFGWICMAAVPGLALLWAPHGEAASPVLMVSFLFCTLPVAALGSGIANPALMAILTFAVPPHKRGAAIGVMSTAESIGRVLGPILAGVLFERVAHGAPIVAAGLISMSTALLALTITVKKPEPAAELKAEASAA